MRMLNPLKCVCILVLANSFVHAQTNPVIHITNTPWRYYQEGREPTNAAQPAVRWMDPAFDDSVWPQGLGVFGDESTPLPAPIQTPLFLTAPGASNQTITYYFRTIFEWSGGSNAFLWFTNLIDYGAVVYLNGTELFRRHVSGTPTYSTFASSGPLMEGVYEITNVLTTRLLSGRNDVAVEVHQSQCCPIGTSPDVVFGMAITATIPEPVIITEQPPNLVDAVAWDEISFSVAATGSQLRYFWYRNGVFISNATNATLFLANISTNQAGTYHVVVSNVLNTVRSSNVLVRVVPDTFSPRLLSAVVPAAEINRMFLTFDEDLLRFGSAAATNVNKFIITEISTGERMPVTNAQVGVGNGLVRLTLSTNLDRGKTYELCLSNVADIRTNYIALNSCVSISFEVITNNFPFASHWWVYDWTDSPPLDWYKPEYFEDPRLWYQAPGMFYNELAGPINPPCTSHGTLLTIGPSAYYFRKHFILPAGILSAPATAILGRVVDDGAIFYLNGTEIMRTNMPAGPVNHGPRALFAGNPNVCLTNQVPISHLLRTNNVLAVEVHQFSSPDYDAAFDSSLSISYLQIPILTNRPPPSDVFLRYSNHSPAQLRLFWTNGMGYALEYVNALGDPWRELQPPSTNLLVNKDGLSRFYRLNKRH